MSEGDRGLTSTTREPRMNAAGRGHGNSNSNSNESRISANGDADNDNGNSNEPRMNADDADRSRPGRGSAHRGRKCCWFLLGARASCAARGLRRVLAPPYTVWLRRARLPRRSPQHVLAPVPGARPTTE